LPNASAAFPQAAVAGSSSIARQSANSFGPPLPGCSGIFALGVPSTAKIAFRPHDGRGSFDPSPFLVHAPKFLHLTLTALGQRGVLSAALEDELDELVFPVKEWGPNCDEIIARFEQRNAANTDQHNPQSMGQAFAGTSKAVMSIAAMDKELKAAGCPQNSNASNYEPAVGSFGPSESLPEKSAPPPVIRPQDATKPTTDLSRYR